MLADAGNAAALAKRQAAALREVALNRRLAGHVYQGAVPIYGQAGGGFGLEPGIQVADWAVAMRRLDERLMLDTMIAEGRARPPDIRRAAMHIAGFYAQQPPGQMTPAPYKRRFMAEIGRSRRVLRRHGTIVSAARVQTLSNGLLHFLDAHASLMAARAAHSIDGHGDLRPEHVCLENPVVIFDCLEFERRLRLVDPVDEMAFLAMECSQLGAPWAEEILFDVCASTVPGWHAPPALVDFYKAVHALIRARLAVLHLEDAQIRQPEKWPAETRARLDTAERFARHCSALVV